MPAPLTLVTLKVGLPVKVVAPKAKFATPGAVLPFPLLCVKVTAPTLSVPIPKPMSVAAPVVRPVLIVASLVMTTLLPKFPPEFRRKSKLPPASVITPLLVVPKAPALLCNRNSPPVTVMLVLAPIKVP